MSKTELVEFMAEEAGMSKAEAGRALEACIKGITKGLVKEGKVSLVGFLTLEKKKEELVLLVIHKLEKLSKFLLEMQFQLKLVAN